MDAARITEILTDPVTLRLVDRQPIVQIAYTAANGKLNPGKSLLSHLCRNSRRKGPLDGSSMNMRSGPGLTRRGQLYLLLWSAITGGQCSCLRTRAASLSIGFLSVRWS